MCIGDFAKFCVFTVFRVFSHFFRLFAFLSIFGFFGMYASSECNLLGFCVFFRPSEIFALSFLLGPWVFGHFWGVFDLRIRSWARDEPTKEVGE